MRPRARCVGGGGDVSVGCGVAHTKHSCRMGCAGSTQVSASYDKPASAPGDKGVDAAGTGVASTAVTSSAGATVSGMVARMPVQGMGSMHDPVAKGISLAYGSCTIPGYDKARPMRANQDDFLCVEEFQNASQSLFVVLDGHGEFGHHVARYCKDKIPHNIRKMLKKSETITEAITDAFFKTNDDLFNTGKVGPLNARPARSPSPALVYPPAHSWECRRRRGRSSGLVALPPRRWTARSAAPRPRSSSFVETSSSSATWATAVW